MRIKTEFIYPPIPIRNFDYSAIDVDTYNGDPTDPIRKNQGGMKIF